MRITLAQVPIRCLRVCRPRDVEDGEGSAVGSDSVMERSRLQRVRYEMIVGHVINIKFLKAIPHFILPTPYFSLKVPHYGTRHRVSIRHIAIWMTVLD